MTLRTGGVPETLPEFEGRDAIVEGIENAGEPGPIVDADGNEESDCIIGWKRNWIQGFTEIETSGGDDLMDFGVATIHFPSETETPGFTPEERAGQVDTWSDKIIAALELRYEDDLDAFSLGGDLNHERCSVEAPVDPTTGKDGEPDEFSNSQTCGEYGWWTDLTGESSHDYEDAIYYRHGANDEDLDAQYNDGCDAAPNAQTGLCEPATQRERKKRIDFVFWKLTEASTTQPDVAASHDLTCGQASGNPNSDPEIFFNCDHLINPERYSDHRLVWSFIEFPPEPVVVTPSPLVTPP